MFAMVFISKRVGICICIYFLMFAILNILIDYIVDYSCVNDNYLVVSEFPEIAVPQIIQFYEMFHSKPTILDTPIYGHPHMSDY